MAKPQVHGDGPVQHSSGESHGHPVPTNPVGKPLSARGTNRGEESFESADLRLTTAPLGERQAR